MIKKESYTVTGMTCSACSARVEKGVSKLKGMDSTSVNLLTGSMNVCYDDTLLDSSAIINTVVELGYGATIRGEEQKSAKKQSHIEEQIREADRMKKRFLFSLCFLIPLMYIAMHHELSVWLGLPIPIWLKNSIHGDENAVAFAFTQFLLLLPIVFLNSKYYRVGFKTLCKGSPNMDSLVAVGSGAAILYGIFALYRVGYGLGHGDMALVHKYAMDMYFESAGTILTLITFGKYLETRSKAKTSDALTKLMQLAPDTAVVERNGKEQTVPADGVMLDDIVLVRPGERIPADGVIIEGVASLDESVITGESLPVQKTVGDSVTSATINKNGFLRLKATHVGEDMAIRRIIKLVEEAGATKAPIARMADKIAGIFVPAVMLIALVAFTVWMAQGAGLEFSLSVAIAVLVISCPCALGLATPVAIMVGTGRGAELGILFKSGEALERTYAVDTVVLDKTGTITEGHPKVTDVKCVHGNENAMLRIAAGIEYGSEHPLAEAVLEYAKLKKIEIPEVSDFTLSLGRGISAVIDGEKCFAGNEAMMNEQGIEISNLETLIRSFAEDGKTPLIVASSTHALGVIAVADTIKANSKKAIEELKEMGIRVLMLTGDNERTAQAIRRILGIDEVAARVLPEDKEHRIASLQKEGHTVAMIGDGINDAPALARADVGMAIGAGTDIAMESADVVLMKSDLLDAVSAIRLGRAVIRNIKQNLFWAFFYNSLGIPLAAGVFFSVLGWKLNPTFGAAAMSLSSFCVVCNALRLRMFQADKNIAEVSEEEKAIAVAEQVPAMNKAILHIEGMMCMHCHRFVTEALTNAGARADVSLENGTALVEYPDTVGLLDLKKAVEDAGYTVTAID